MKITLRFIFMLFLLVISRHLQAQITGTVTVPSTTYPSLASVITALNTQGVGTGGAIINLTTGSPQTAPSGGYQLGSTVLNASLSAATPLVFNGNGNTVTAPAGLKGISSGGDGIFWLRGTDYVTIDALHLQESAANTDTTLAMEYGYVLVNLNAAAPFDGCNRNTIKNCNVSLGKTLLTPTIGIYSGHRTMASGAALTVTAAGDLSSYNKFYGNIVSNVTSGIRLDGFADVAPYAFYDRGNDIGGTAAATGNTITNFGGVNYTSIGGISMAYQDSANVSYNIVNDTANGGVPPIGGFWGIYCFGTNSTFNISNNNIVLRGASINTTFFIYGIYANAAGTNMTAQNNVVNVGQRTGSTSPVYGMFFPNGNNLTCNGNTVSGLLGVSSAGYGVYTTYVGNVAINSNTFQYSNSAAVTGAYNAIYNAGTSVSANINNNIFDNITTNTSGTVYLIYNGNATPLVNINNNRIGTQFTRSATSSNTFYGIYNGSSPAGTTLISGNNFSNVTLNGTGGGYGIAYNTNTGVTQKVVNDTFTNWTMNGSGTLYGINVTYGLLSTIDSNLVSGLTGGGTIYGIYTGNTSTIASATYNNTVSALSSTGASSAVYGIYISGTTTTAQDCYANKIYGINAGGASGTAYGIYLNGGNITSIYNNFISGLTTPVSSGTSPVYGIYLSTGNRNNVYFNTINLTPVSTGTNFGATGVYYTSSASSVLDLRNNIIRVAATPAGTGTVVALRRSSGTAGTTPANLAPTTNANVYYVPAATNAYLYLESTSTTAVNGFNLTSDPGFNTFCGLYKTFMSGREKASATEDNLTQIGTTNTFAPTGTSYAKSGGVATTAPAVTTDYNNVARPAIPDAGALQFTGTANDIAGPNIVYTALPVFTYCTSAPALIATITDATGVNNTAGTAPRLYYKKGPDADTFGVANTSAGNGWKWVEATVTGSTYTFNFDYSKLQTAIAVGDSIVYFVIAQDTKSTPNIGINIAGFRSPFCPSSVALPAAAGPLATTTSLNNYKIIATPAFTATATNKSICVSGVSVLSLSPAPAAGSSLQWQQDNGTGTFTDIATATTSPFTTGAITATNRFRAVIKCGTSVIATSTQDTVTVTSPRVLTTAPATRCGIGTLILGATGTNLKWYDTSAGGTSIGAGASFTTPSITATKTFYVTASTGGVSENLPSPTAGSSTFITTTAGWGLRFTANTTATITSVNIKALGTTAGPASIQIKVTDLSDVVVYTGTLYNFTITTALAVYTVPVNITVAPGNYKMVMTYTGISDMVRESTGVTFPYTAPSGAISITAGANGTGSASTTSAYYWFYNWVISGGCESARVPVVATISTAPPVTAASTAPATGLCAGNSATVSVTSANPGYGYVWSTGSTASSFSVTPTATTKYVVTATDPVTSCAAKDSVTITVVNQTATITPSAAQTICTGNSVVLAANSAPNQVYTWYLGTTVVGSGATYTANAAGSYTVKVVNTVTNCQATSAAVVVNVVAPPTATISPAGNQTLCTGSTLTLTGPTGTGYTYQWKNGATNATGASTGVTYNATAGGAYTLVVSANGCSTTSAVTNVTLLPLPVPVITPSAPATGCDSVVLGSTSPGITYQWNYGGNPILGATNATYGAQVSGNYSLTATSIANGCSATTANVAITVNQSPAAVITYSSPITFCDGGAVVLNTYTGANLSYEWRNSNAPIPGATTNTYITTTTGVYTVKVANTVNNCVRISAPVNVRVNPAPTPVVTYNTVTNTLSTTQPFAQYQWVLNTQPIAGATQRTYTPSQSGAYYVNVVDTNGCSAQAQIVFVNSVGIINTPFAAAIKIYPNPSAGLLFVKSPVPVSIALRDITGKTVLQSVQGEQLDLGELADGMYLLYITDKQGQLVRVEKVTKSVR